MSLLCELTPGVSILLTFVALIGAIGAIVLLYYITARERRRYTETKFIDKDKRPKDFDNAVTRLIHRLSARSSFHIVCVEVGDTESMTGAFGVMQMESAYDILRKRCASVFPFLVDICNYEPGKIMILISQKTDDQELGNYLENLLIEVRKPIVLAGALKIEADVNVAVVHSPTAGRSTEELYKNLELTMVVSKRQGLNKCVFHTRDLNSAESDEFKQYMEIRKAIANNEFTLYYQKIVESDMFQTYAFECLLRWNHKEQGVLSPDTFLKVMEHSGDINWVGQWAFEQVCTLLFEWTRRKVRRYAIGFNLSAKQLCNNNLYGEMRKLIKNYNVDPAQIHLEISDYRIWNKLDVARINITALKEAGFRISLDDFDPQEADYTLIELIRPQFIKMDRRFLVKAMTDAAAEKDLQTLCDFAAESEISLVACGIEDEETVDFVKNHAIRYAQGYFFSKPKPVEELQL